MYKNTLHFASTATHTLVSPLPHLFGKFGMALSYLFCFILFSQFVPIFSAGNGKDYHENCPRSFDCGSRGSFEYPFTKAELPDCGLLLIHGCDDGYYSQKMIQLDKHHQRSVVLTDVVEQNKIISIFDDDFHSRLEKDVCDTMNYNYSIPPPSPLLSIHIQYNVSLFRCNRSLQIEPPVLYLKHECQQRGFNIYYDKILTSPDQRDTDTTFSNCSLVQFATKDVTNSTDILSFVSSEVVLVVALSDACDEYFHHRRGQCRLDTANKFYCHRGLGITLLIGILIFGCFLGGCYRRKQGPPDLQFESKSTLTDANDPYRNPDPESGREFLGIPLFSYQELKEATNSFNHTTQLGIGGFGTVYYGKLQDRREVAVKRLYEHKRVKQFTNEIKILTHMRHRNLVSLYGCTSRHSHELLLVYEYVLNNTVAYHLHGDLANATPLPWHIRMKIATETVISLSYLHSSDIIHRDVKTSNILLDNSYTVKVADFGLSRLFPNDVTYVSTAPQGTPGYVDPEYYRCYQLTSKYSFGVVLIELISSKPAVDMNRNKDEINLADLAVKKIQTSAVSELVDPSLGFESDNEVRRMIVSVAELAFQCLQRDRELRPSMDEVLKMLVTIESGKDRSEVVEEVDELPPSSSSSPPSPDFSKIVLLKSMSMMWPSPSPNNVTGRWSSESTTPNVSG